MLLPLQFLEGGQKSDLRRQLLDGLTSRWLESLDARLAIAPRSPVEALDRLLVARAKEVNP